MQINDTLNNKDDKALDCKSNMDNMDDKALDCKSVIDNKDASKEDKLDVIFRMQKELNDYIIRTRNLSFTKEEWLLKRSVALIDETMEMLKEANYKWWKNPKENNSDELKEELVDMLHFFVGLCIDAGMSAEEMFQIYLSKNKENYDRQMGLSDKKGYSLKG